jgi:multidrug resistance efflux pump
MQEALDDQATVVFPPPEGSLPRAAQAHRELSRQFGAKAICSVPLVRAGEACAAVTLERDEPFAGRVLGLVEVATALVGPSLDALRLESRFIGTKLVDSLRELAARFLGPHEVALKLIGGSLALLLLFLTFAKGDYRITADAVLVPDMRRVAVAPFDGFIAEAPVRAGDTVAEGQLLASLDDRDLELERVKWASENAQALKQYRQALSERDPARAEILMASVEESRAELDRILGHLARSDLRAPFEGVVVAGDLTQKLGAPVRRGEVLFEVAPLDAYRVEMQVGEGDIADIALEQSGTLVLSALPDDEFRFVVNKITPVATAEEGKNTFLVEARIQDDLTRLRPGVEGVAKIEVDERRLIWIWTHGLIDWLRVKLWAFLP